MISHVCQTRGCKILAFLCKENIFKLKVKWKGVGNLMENWPYLENGER